MDVINEIGFFCFFFPSCIWLELLTCCPSNDKPWLILRRPQVIENNLLPQQVGFHQTYKTKSVSIEASILDNLMGREIRDLKQKHCSIYLVVLNRIETFEISLWRKGFRVIPTYTTFHKSIEYNSKHSPPCLSHKLQQAYVAHTHPCPPPHLL